MSDFKWVEKNQNIMDIIDRSMKVKVTWEGKPGNDFLSLSRYYQNAGYLTCKEIIEVS